MLKKVIAGRFSKPRVLRDLWARYDMLQACYKFDPNNGTSQLKPLNQVQKENLQARTLAYGEWQGIATIIRLIEGGSLGYGD